MDNNPFKPQPRIEIVRSFSRKINLGNYESLDMFASAKMECDLNDAAGVSLDLFEFAKNEVLQSIISYRREMSGLQQQPEDEAVHSVQQRSRDSAAKIASRSTDQYFVEEIPPDSPAPAPQPDLKQQVDQKMDEAKKACEEMAATIMKTVKGAKKKEHLAQYYMGWFGIEDAKQLPKNPGEYIEALRGLVGIVTNDESTHARFLEHPRVAGEGVRKAFEERLSKSQQQPPQATNGYVTEPHAFVDEPLMKHFGWTSLDTVNYAKVLMKKNGQDLPNFEKYLKFLNMSMLEEEDLLALFRMLYFGADNAYAIWKKAQGKQMPLRIALNMVQRHLGGSLTMQTPAEAAAKAINAAMGDMG